MFMSPKTRDPRHSAALQAAHGQGSSSARKAALDAVHRKAEEQSTPAKAEDVAVVKGRQALQESSNRRLSV